MNLHFILYSIIISGLCVGFRGCFSGVFSSKVIPVMTPVMNDVLPLGRKSVLDYNKPRYKIVLYFVMDYIEHDID